MSAHRLLFTGLICMVLFGCATTKPPMPEANYEMFSRGYVKAAYCGAVGFMDVGTASLGLRYIESNVSSYSFDLNRLNQEITNAKLSNTTYTKEQCNLMSMDIVAKKRSIDQGNEIHQKTIDELNQIVNNRQRSTICNKIGASVFCNTY